MGLSGPLRVGSSALCGSHSSAELFSFIHQVESSPGGDRGVDRQRGCRARPVISRLLQSPVRGPEGFRVVEACDRPVVVERLRPIYAVQDGVQPVGSPVHQDFRLHDLHRPQRCLPSGSDSSIQQEVLEVCCRRLSLSVQGSSFRSLHGPSSVHKGHGSSVFFSPQPGRSDVALFGRLASTSLISSGASGDEGQGAANVQSVRN